MTAPPAGSVRIKAVRGIAWTLATSLGARGLQLVGTVALLNIIARHDYTAAYGEATNAANLAVLAHTAVTFGVPHYLVSRKTDRATAWHATLVLGTSGIIALLLPLLVIGPISMGLKSPGLGRYLPLLALSTLIGRMAFVPERLLQQQLRFREASLARGAGEIAYTVFSVGAAILGAGGMAVVAGNLARSVLFLGGLCWVLKPSEWATPHPFERRIVREMFTYGLPLGASLWLMFASKLSDNFVVSNLFGAAVVGVYSFAYSFADIPASQVGEQVGDVLTPSFVYLNDAGRKAGVVRATALLGLVVFPLAVGLGVTGPTVADTILRPELSEVGTMLIWLSALSVARPVGYTIGSYLQTTQRSRIVLWLSTLRVVVLVGAVYGLGRAFGVLGACTGVGVAFSVHALASAAFIIKKDGISAASLISAVVRPLLACAPLVLAVLGARAGLASLGVHIRFVNLGVEIAAGAIGYVAGAFLFANAFTRDLLRVAMDLRRKRGAKQSPEGEGEAKTPTSPGSTA